ncbi:MAG: hypothetical protein BalsKO_08130 [Balneolaceae bacterium]
MTVMRAFKTFLLLILISIVSTQYAFAQDSRAITMEEYELAQSFEVEDLDNDTYIKFNNKYILDRYEYRDPIFITGDDGNRKRVDLYKLVAREGLIDLGVMVFFTTEVGTLYKALIPNFEAGSEVWEAYFEDIHSIDKEEENFVLKLSYVLSREFSFQMLKGAGVELPEDEGATYGSDICFPGDQLVSLADGSEKSLREIEIGDKVITLDPSTKFESVVEVSKLVKHTPENYAITTLVLINEQRIESKSEIEFLIKTKELKATPNHPMLTSLGNKKMGDIQKGEEVLSWDEESGQYKSYIVYQTKEYGEGIQPVYSIEAKGGNPLLMNGVVVKQKE